MVIGVANYGGVINATWSPELLEGLERGLDITSGMHSRLSQPPVLQSVAARLGRQLIDVRVPPPNIPVATGKRRSGKRLQTVGRDCAPGKKYTAMAIAKAFAAEV